MNTSEERQKRHFNRLAELYDTHYNDRYSQYYRRRFIYMPLFGGIDLKGKLVLEGMCGSGESTDYLLERGARVVGLDISKESIRLFKKSHPGCEAVCRSILDTGFKNNTFDAVVVIGGFHHMPPHVGQAFDEVYRILKPGGYLAFMEPSAGSLVDIVRKPWYKHDPMFEKNEAALDIGALKKEYNVKYNFIVEKYEGGLAYYFVQSSMIFRIPPKIKWLYSWLFLLLDRLTSPLIGRWNAAFCNCVWQKK